jgi:D-alanyl-D-alanine carboxypeptidase/D-alanyl-D-alanine-endopeptidase (penicillin-binding protein 4)
VVAAATPQPNTGAPADPSRVAAKIAAIKPAAGTVGAVSVDLASGTTLYSKNADTLLMPASNLKSLTGIALLDAMDAGTRFATKVVSATSSTASSPSPAASSPRAITLVGGGDPYLLSVPSKIYPQFASTQNLARSTAAALKRQGVTAVTLGYDDSLFSGPDWNPTWQADYADQVTHVSALWVDEGLPAGATARSTTPALQAAQVFAGQLRADGITVSGTPSATRAASSASTLAEVQSAPVEDLLKRALLSSDNSTTEVLSHQMAIASGQPATFAGAATALQQHLTRMGAWQSGAVIKDGCGLSRGNRVSATMLERAWRYALRTPRTQPIADLVPVSGVSGSLTARFQGLNEVAGRGVVHAKTGTLTGVAALSGWLRSADGRIVVQATIINNSPDPDAAHTWLDSAWSAVAGCGCTP